MRLSCFRCHEEKEAKTGFPMGRSGKRRSSVCWACVEDEAYERLRRAMAYRATWLDPVSGRVVRRCAVCKAEKDLERDFYRTPYYSENSRWPKVVPCKLCADALKKARDARKIEHVRARHRAATRRYIQRHGDAIRARNKQNWKAIKADPVKYAKVLEDARINRRLRKERRGDPNTKRPPSPRVSQATGPRRLPSAPLVGLILGILSRRAAVGDFLADAGGADIESVCHDLGITSRTFRRWRAGSATEINVAVAERVLLRAGVEWSTVYSYDDHAEVFLAMEPEPGAQTHP